MPEPRPPRGEYMERDMFLYVSNDEGNCYDIGRMHRDFERGAPGFFPAGPNRVRRLIRERRETGKRFAADRTGRRRERHPLRGALSGLSAFRGWTSVRICLFLAGMSAV